MEENTTIARTNVCKINYHIVWSVRRRIRVLTPDVASYLYELIQTIAKDKGFEVSDCQIVDEHYVHLYASAPPKIAPSRIVQYLKGISGWKIAERFPELRDQLWKGQLWNHSFYLETIGSPSEENMKQFLERQSTQY